MMKRYLLNPADNMKGSMLIIVVIIIMVLTSIGIYGLTSTSVGLLAAGTDRKALDYFGNAEAGLNFAITNFDSIYDNTDRNGGNMYCTVGNIDGPFVVVTLGAAGIIQKLNFPCVGIGGGDFTALSAMVPPDPNWTPLSSAYVVFDYTINPNVNGGAPVARIEIKPFTIAPVNNPNLSSAANNVIPEPHLGPAPPGYSNDVEKGYKSRNFCITSTALDGNGQRVDISVQSGVVKAVQKQMVDFLAGL